MLSRSARARLKRQQRKQAKKESQYQMIDHNSDCSMAPSNLSQKPPRINNSNPNASDEIPKGNGDNRSNSHLQNINTNESDELAVEYLDSIPSSDSFSSHERTAEKPAQEPKPTASLNQLPQASNSLEFIEKKVSTVAITSVTAAVAPSVKKHKKLNRNPTKQPIESTVHVTRALRGGQDPPFK